jgi:sugar/nucleoside kinase (ribokinase family)
MLEAGGPALYRVIVVVDAESFTHPVRTNADLTAVRAGIYRILRNALDGAAIPWADCESQDRGDGAIVLVSPSYPKLRLFCPLPAMLRGEVLKYNAGTAPTSRIRLRVAVHAGEVSDDGRGFVGGAVNLACRVVDSMAVKDFHASAVSLVTMVVSAEIFNDVVRHDAAAEPDTYSALGVVSKNLDCEVYAKVIGGLPVRGPEPALSAMPATGLRARDQPAELEATANESAIDELRRRLAATRGRSLDALAVTAHNLDRVHEVDLIAPDHEAEVVAPARMHAGGAGANTAAALARLGIRTATIGAVGDDAEGTILREALEHADVDTSFLLTVPGTATGQALVLHDALGQRSIYPDPGANTRLMAALQASPPLAERAVLALRDSRILHLTSFTGYDEFVMQQEMVAGVDADTIVSFTPGEIYSRDGADALEGILLRTNLLFLYEEHLDKLLINSAAAHPSAGAPVKAKLAALFDWRRSKASAEPLLVSVKRPAALTQRRVSDYLHLAMGRTKLDWFSHAVESSSAGRQHEPEAEGLAQVRDSTGAGDAMAAGLMFGLLQAPESLTEARLARECMNVAFVMAMAASSQTGARTGHPNRSELAIRWSSYLSSGNVPGWLTGRVLER